MQDIPAVDHCRLATWLNRNVVAMGLTSLLSNLGHDRPNGLLALCVWWTRKGVT